MDYKAIPQEWALLNARLVVKSILDNVFQELKRLSLKIDD